MNNSKSNIHQKGLATLVVTVVIVILMTLVVLFAVKVGIFDQRMSANEARYKEAFAQADSGLDYASQRFNSQFIRLFDGSDTTTATTTLTTILANSQVASATEADGTSPEASDGSFTVAITAGVACFPVPTPPATCATTSGSVPIYTFSSTGVGVDGTGTATVQRDIVMASALGGAQPNVPVIVGGVVGAGGSFNVVANPNAAGYGVPVSIWAEDTVTVPASAATCHLQFYDGQNAQCSNPSGNVENLTTGHGSGTTASVYTSTMPDIVPKDPNFPPDLFQFLFGITSANWATKKAEAAAHGQVVTDCSDLVFAGTNAGANFPIWWVDGDCAIGGGGGLVIGSDSKPVILIVDDHELKMTGKVAVKGIVYIFDNPDNVATPTASLNGTTEIFGSFVSDVGGVAMQGSYSVVYDPNVLNSFTNGGGSNYTMTYVPGSWRDF